VSLLAGHGASLAVAGAYVLAEQLARHGADAAPSEYERLLRPLVAERQRRARAAMSWFLPRSRAHLRARRAALALARLPVLDTLLARTIVGMPTPLEDALGVP
jgi:2-polyprenyl-6-methoxyphenol hydroxylase-like FAD-dependent oxidoreductase